jgi:hypothetical protein
MSSSSIVLMGPAGQGPAFLEMMTSFAAQGPAQLKMFLKSLAYQQVLKLVYVVSTRTLMIFYGQDQVAINICPYWDHTTLPPPTVTINGVVITTYDVFGIDRNGRTNFHRNERKSKGPHSNDKTDGGR